MLILKFKCATVESKTLRTGKAWREIEVSSRVCCYIGFTLEKLRFLIQPLRVNMLLSIAVGANLQPEDPEGRDRLRAMEVTRGQDQMHLKLLRMKYKKAKSMDQLRAL
jgi:hypothetical protein